MKARNAARLAWSVAVFAAACSVVSLYLLSLNGYTLGEIVSGYSAGGAIFALSYAAVGAVVASKRPKNPMGWIFLIVALSQGFDSFDTQYGEYAVITNPNSLPGGAFMTWAATWTFAPGAGLLATLTLLLFPDGSLPSPRWKWVPWAVGAGITLMVVPTAAAAASVPAAALIRGGAAAHSPEAMRIAGSLRLLGLLLIAICMMASVVSLFMRFRHAAGPQRAQLKWLAYAASVTIPTFIAISFPGVREFLSKGVGVPLALVALVVVIPSIPLAVAIAIFKYRLYDIDLIINRTLVYGALTALLGAIYTLGVVVIPRALRVGGDSELVVAGSTLVVAALFQPLRRRVQDLIDRGFYRRKYDAARTVEAFSTRLRDEVDLEAMRLDLMTVVQETMQPRRVSVWLK